METWVKGLVSAGLGGAANAVTAMAIDPAQFNLSDGLPKLGIFALIGMIMSVALYLKQSPLP